MNGRDTPRGMPSRDPNENITSRNAAHATDFDPFDALGIPCISSHNEKSIRSAYLRASKLSHTDKRTADTATLFPSFIQVKAAYDYLGSNFPHGLRRAVSAWQAKHQPSWNPVAESAQAAWFPLHGQNAPQARSMPTLQRATASAATPSTGPATPAWSSSSSYRPPPPPRRPQQQRPESQPSGNGTRGRPQPSQGSGNRESAQGSGIGGSWDDPLEVDESESESEFEAAPSPTPAGPPPSTRNRPNSSGGGSGRGNPSSSTFSRTPGARYNEHFGSEFTFHFGGRRNRDGGSSGHSGGAPQQDNGGGGRGAESRRSSQYAFSYGDIHQDVDSPPTPNRPRPANVNPCNNDSDDEDNDGFSAGGTGSGTTGNINRASFGRGAGSSGGAASSRVRRSGGNSVRNAPVANPITGESIMLGEWSQSPVTPRHAVIGRFDVRGRFNRRIVAQDVNGSPLPSSTVTSCPHEDVVYRVAFQGMDNMAVRSEVDRQLRIPSNQRQ